MEVITLFHYCYFRHYYAIDAVSPCHGMLLAAIRYITLISLPPHDMPLRAAYIAIIAAIATLLFSPCCFFHMLIKRVFIIDTLIRFRYFLYFHAITLFSLSPRCAITLFPLLSYAFRLPVATTLMPFSLFLY